MAFIKKLLMLITVISNCNSRIILETEVLEIDDLMILNDTKKVGNLEHGFPCRTPAGMDITDDVCFHSHPLLQCISGNCACAYIRLSDTQVKQMVYDQGACRRLEGWPCKSTEECAKDLTCFEVKQTIHGSQPSHSNSRVYNQPEDKISAEEIQEIEHTKHYRKLMKERLHTRLQILEIQTRDQNLVLVGDPETTTKELDDLTTTASTKTNNNQPKNNVVTSTTEISLSLDDEKVSVVGTFCLKSGVSASNYATPFLISLMVIMMVLTFT